MFDIFFALFIWWIKLTATSFPLCGWAFKLLRKIFKCQIRCSFPKWILTNHTEEWKKQQRRMIFFCDFCVMYWFQFWMCTVYISVPIFLYSLFLSKQMMVSFLYNTMQCSPNDYWFIGLLSSDNMIKVNGNPHSVIYQHAEVPVFYSSFGPVAIESHHRGFAQANTIGIKEKLLGHRKRPWHWKIAREPFLWLCGFVCLFIFFGGTKKQQNKQFTYILLKSRK